MDTKVSDLIARCKRDYFIADVIDNNDFIRYFNDVQKRLYNLSDKKKESLSAITLVEGQFMYDLPEDCIEVDTVWLDNKALTLVSVEWLNTFKPEWRSETGTPSFYFIDKGQGKLGLYPAPASSSYTFVLKYEYRPIPLNSIDNELSTPSEWDDVYVHYALWMAAESYRDFPAATRRSSMYSARLQEIEDESTMDSKGYTTTVDVVDHPNWRFGRWAGNGTSSES